MAKGNITPQAFDTTFKKISGTSLDIRAGSRQYDEISADKTYTVNKDLLPEGKALLFRCKTTVAGKKPTISGATLEGTLTTTANTYNYINIVNLGTVIKAYVI